MSIRSVLSKALAIAAVPAIALGMSGCAKDSGDSGSAESGDKGEAKQLKIFATTGYIGDAVKNIAPDAEVHTMVGPGGDPHTYQPTTDDLEKLKNWDLVISNGLHMEAKMLDQLAETGDKHLAVGEKLSEDELLPWEEDGKVEGHDPHIWNSPTNWQKVVKAIGDFIAEKDEANAETYKKNAEEFANKIGELHEKAKEKFDAIPKDKRILITGHDAFNYLGETYGLEIHATDFVSTEATKSAAEIDELAQLIVDKKVKTIFVDTTANPQAIKSLQEKVKAKGGEVEISDKELYADTLGEEAPVDTYLGVFEHNADTISEALSK